MKSVIAFLALGLMGASAQAKELKCSIDNLYGARAAIRIQADAPNLDGQIEKYFGQSVFVIYNGGRQPQIESQKMLVLYVNGQYTTYRYQGDLEGGLEVSLPDQLRLQCWSE